MSSNDRLAQQPRQAREPVRWLKQGNIFNVRGQPSWMASHAAVPVPYLIDDDRLRVYFGPRDSEGRTRIAFIDVDPADPFRVLEVHDTPALDLGRRGAFDDSGVMPSCLFEHRGALYLYYIGWNRTVTVPYRNAIGLAISTDGGLTFTRLHEGPIVDRNALEPYFVTTPFVRYEDELWRMWYASATGWVDEPPNPVYVIKYAESMDGVEWTRRNVTCIEPKSSDEANGRPWIEHDGDGYRMWYSFRGVHGFRTNPAESYQMGYAESADGVTWDRKDDVAGIERSASGWDSEMVAYPSIYQHRGLRHLLYNGNGFGQSGIGHALAAELDSAAVRA